MTTTPEQLAAQLGIGQAVPQRITPWCRGMGCTEVLDWLLVDREDGSGLHALCTELVQPAVYAGRTEPDAETAAAIAVLREQAGAEVISEGDVDPATGGIPLGGPCTDPWCTKNGRPCGFDVAAHINAHGPKILTNPANGPDKPIPATEYEPEQNGGQPYLIPAAGTTTAFAAPAALPGDSPLKAEIINIVRWYDSSRPRSLQRAIGMSEVGVDCLRRLAYSALEVQGANAVKDPWFAIVGTSVHAWLADALQAHNQRDGNTTAMFQVEQRVTASDGTVAVSGSTDFYRNAVVGDHKVVGSTALKKYRDHGPSQQYRTQVHINGLGWEQAGWPVDTVALLFYPRSGFLDHMHVWSEPYNRQVALDALARLGSVKTTATLLGPAALPAKPEFAGCVWCPFYNPNLTGADGTGCPGR